MPRAILRLNVLHARALAADGRLDAALAILDALPDRFLKTRDARLRAELEGARRERASLSATAEQHEDAREVRDALVRDLDRSK